MQKDLSNAARNRGPGRVSLVGSLGVLAVLLAGLTIASYPRVAVGATAGVAATVLVRQWYARVGTLEASTSRQPPGVRSGADGERGRTDKRDARLANGQG